MLKRRYIKSLYMQMMCWCSYPDLKPPSPVISSFGAFSGYKINFAKSEAMPLGSLLTVPVTTVPFPFRGLLLGLLIYIRVSPSYQLFKLNFVPLFDSIKADLESLDSSQFVFINLSLRPLYDGLYRVIDQRAPLTSHDDVKTLFKDF